MFCYCPAGKTKQNKKKHEKKDQLPAGEEDEKNSDAETAR